MSELDLVKRCQAGDQQAWAELFELHADHVFKLAFLITRDRQDAHDVTQETFLRLIKCLDKYDASRGSFETWLCAIAVNLSRDHLRRRKRFPTPWDLVDGELRLVDRGALPEDISLAREWQQAIWNAINGLGEKHRTVIILHYYLGFSCVEIGQMLSCAEGTVYSRLHYARQVLEKKLGHEAPNVAWAAVGGVGK